MDAQARAAVASMWDAADYDTMATLLRPAAESLAAATADLAPGPVLDLAAGTGSTTVEVATRGRHVDAVDIAPGLVQTGRSRCDRLGLDTTWSVGDLDDLAGVPTLGRDYCAAVSSFGLIFAPSPTSTLREVASRLRPGGTLALTTWDPLGYVAGMGRAMTSTLAPDHRGPAIAWVRWGDPDTLASWLTDAGFARPAIERRTLPWRFPSARAAVEFLFTCSPGHVAGARAAADGGAALRAAVLEHLLAWGGPPTPEAPVDLDSAYLVVTAVRL